VNQHLLHSVAAVRIVMIAQKTSFGVVGFGRGIFTLPNGSGRAALEVGVGPIVGTTASADGSTGVAV
jgi:hypothetical protein